MIMHTRTKHQRGFNLLEVVIAIAVFFIGLLALASLQGSLTRSMADSRMRSEAANLAERRLESLRGFTSIPSVAGQFAYNDIVDATTTQVVGGVTYTIALDVTDFYYAPAAGLGNFTTTAPTGAAASSFKRAEVVVGWNQGQAVRNVNEAGGEIAATALNPDATVSIGGTQVTGIKMTTVIPALVTSASSKVTEEEDSDLPVPQVTYQPGQNPDVIALSLGATKFKESLTPMPNVIRTDLLVDTSFDVITYSTTNNGSFFLRREAFRATSCECTLRGPAVTNQGNRPVVWAGDEYARGHAVTKPYGESANNQQSSLCNACCRDHHDGGSSAKDSSDVETNLYGPFKASSEYHTSGTLAGDHKHYKANGTLAAVGEVYLEACSMVRVDGFNRVKQDFRREDQYVFPQDFLDGQSEIDLYSSYTTGAALAYEGATYPNYHTNPPCIGGPTPCVANPARQGARPAPIATDAEGNPTEFPSWTELQHNTNALQQLRSRGIYIDYLTFDLRTVVNCLQAGGDKESCKSGDVILDRTGSENVLEILPFFDVQRTWLDRWNENPTNVPVDVTNQELRDNNSHSRGVASESAQGTSTVFARSHRGNLGFTDTQRIDPLFDSNTKQAELKVHSVAGSSPPPPPPPPTGNTLSGNITHTLNGNPTLAIQQGGDAVCNRTPAGWSCTVPIATSTATITITGYGSNSKNRWACGAGLTKIAEVASGTGAYATFSLVGKVPGTTYHISVSQPGDDVNPCP